MHVSLDGARRRCAVLLTAVVIGSSTWGCGAMRSGSDNSFEADVRLRPEAVLSAARTQLMHHGYKVTEAGENAIVTQPRAVPKHLQDADRALAGRSWILRVEASPKSFSGGSGLRVIGYLLPPAARSATAQAMEQATVVTAAQKGLFSEVRAAAGWITDEAKRTSKR